MRALGFTNLTRTVDREELDLGGLTVAIHVETSITDGPGGDSALVVGDGEVRLVDQNDCRTTDLDALRAHGPVDLHWLQYSGAIWYPMVYELPDGELRAAGPGEGGEPARPGDALRRVGRCPGSRAERRPAVLPRPRAVPPQRHPR